MASLSCLSSSLASAQGIVSSMYLLHLLNNVKISVIASATLNLSIFSAALTGVSKITFLKSSSTSSSTPLLLTTPSKYLFDIEIVLLTRFPNVLARSEFILSTINSQVIVPSFSNGISWSTKYLTASTPKRFAKSSA